MLNYSGVSPDGSVCPATFAYAVQQPNIVIFSGCPLRITDKKISCATIALDRAFGIDYLVTWNCKHIANAQVWSKLRYISNNAGYELPIICTPEELMEDDYV